MVWSMNEKDAIFIDQNLTSRNEVVKWIEKWEEKIT